MDTLNVSCTITREKEGFAAVCAELDIASMGETAKEAQANLQEAVTGHLQVAKEEGLLDGMLERIKNFRAHVQNKRTQSSVSTPLSIPLPL